MAASPILPVGRTRLVCKNCPHCGFALPAVADAFCPDCRERLDEAPAPVVEPSRSIELRGFKEASESQRERPPQSAVTTAAPRRRNRRRIVRRTVWAHVAAVTVFLALGLSERHLSNHDLAPIFHAVVAILVLLSLAALFVCPAIVCFACLFRCTTPRVAMRGVAAEVLLCFTHLLVLLPAVSW